MFDPKHILVPVAIDPDEDLSLAQHALWAACDIAAKFSSQITLLHLTPALQPGGGSSIDVSGQVYQSFVQVMQARIANGRAKLKELQVGAESRGIAVEVRMMDSFDSTGPVIIQAAEEMKADLLVMCSHGRRGLSRLLFGSVAEKIANLATMPVLLLHPQAQAKDKK